MVGNIFDNIKEPWWLGDRPIPRPCLLPVPLWLSGVCNDCMIIYHRQSNDHVLVIFLRQDCTPVQQAQLMCTFVPQTNKQTCCDFSKARLYSCAANSPTPVVLSSGEVYQPAGYFLWESIVYIHDSCKHYWHWLQLHVSLTQILSPGMCSGAWWRLRSWSTSPVGLSGPAWSLLGGRRRWVSTPSNTFKLKNLYIRKRGYSVSQTNEFSL